MGVFDIDRGGWMKELEKLEDIDAVAPQMVDAGLEVLEKGVRDGYSRHRRSGDLVNSIKVKKGRKTNNGYYGYVAPEGNDSRGVRNVDKAVYLENGTWKQPSTPVVGPAVAGCESQVVSAMEKKYKEMMG